MDPKSLILKSEIVEEFKTGAQKREEEEKEAKTLKPLGENALDKYKRRKREKEEKKKRQFEAELEAEQMVKDDMKQTKYLVEKNAVMVERISGVVGIEGKEGDFEIEASFNDVVIKPCLETKNRELVIFGKNLTADSVRDILQAFRSQFPAPVSERSQKTLTESEIEGIETSNSGKQVPPGFIYDGSLYRDMAGKAFERHPDLEGLIEKYIEEENEKI